MSNKTRAIDRSLDIEYYTAERKPDYFAMSPESLAKRTELYVLIFPNGKRYFGISFNAKNRWARHKKRASRGGRAAPLYCALRKYGSVRVEMRILAVGTRRYILDLEKRVIGVNQTNKKRFGYNATPGGELTPFLVPEIQKKMRRGWTAAERRELSRLAKARGQRPSAVCLELARNVNLGRPLSEKTRALLSSQRRGVPKSFTHRLAISKAKTGRKRRPDECAAISLGHIGCLHSDETRKKMQVSQSARRERERSLREVL